MAGRLAVLVIQVEGVEEFAVDVELELIGGAIADPDRPRSAVAFEMVERPLGEIGSPVEGVKRLQWCPDATSRSAGPATR